MGFLSFFLGEKTKTASVAKERLQIILAHERNGRTRDPAYLPDLQRELLAVISKYVSVGPGDIKVEVGQAFETPDQIWIDILSEGMGGHVAKLRLFKASEVVEGSDDGVFDAIGGTLQMPGIGAWIVGCSGP